MDILFIHNNFPAQYRHIAQTLANTPGNRVVFITKNKTTDLPGIIKLVYEPAREPNKTIHHYLHQFEQAILDGQAVFRVMQQLKAKGFNPDVVCVHTGWGQGMFVKDAFPDTKLVLYCEWFTRSHGADFNFDPAFPSSVDDMLNYRASNAAMLIDLEAADAAVAPTHWQKSRFPTAFHPMIQVLHDGVDTDYFIPKPGAKLQIPGLDLSETPEIITYVARGMDSYRGFPQFIEAVNLVLRRRPQCHVVVVGENRIAYGPAPPGGGLYKEYMLAKVPIDLTRLHFVGSLNYGLYKQVLQASSVHVYLTRPFVLSWSLLEALSMGCLVVASNTTPVKEVIDDSINGLLTDFFDTEALANRIEQALDMNASGLPLREAARQRVLDNYALKTLLPQHLALLQS
jgi:glycosyltransferase involved in cell wall biosynthesis